MEWNRSPAPESDAQHTHNRLNVVYMPVMQTNPIDPDSHLSSFFFFFGTQLLFFFYHLFGITSPVVIHHYYTTMHESHKKKRKSKQYGLLLIWSPFRSVMYLYGTCPFRISILLWFATYLKSGVFWPCSIPFFYLLLLGHFFLFSSYFLFVPPYCWCLYFFGGINLIDALFVGIASSLA